MKLPEFKHETCLRVNSFTPNGLIFLSLKCDNHRIAELPPLFEGKGNS